MAEFRFDVDRLGKAERTPSGGVKVPAALTRVGIFEYRRADGTTQLEFRPPEEVFRDDSLASFAGAAVTVGHPPEGVNAGNWSSLSKGHIVDGSIRKDGAHVAAALTLQDGPTIARVDCGELSDLSLGYSVDYDPTPGTYQGRRYDGVQRNIRGNHVALLPKGAGRAGPDCALRLDSSAAVCELPERAGAQPPAENKTMKIRLDGKEYEYGSPEHIAAEREDAAKQAEAKAQTAANKRADTAEAERDALRVERDALKDPKRFDTAVSARVALLVTAGNVLGTDYRADGKTDNEIRIDVIKKADPKFDPKDRTDAYVQARFDLIAESGPRADSISNAPEAVRKAQEQRGDSGESREEKAKRESQERSRNAWKDQPKAS